MAPNPVYQAVATTALAYATYLTAVCPCNKLLSCHRTEFITSVGVALGLYYLDNGRLL